MREKSSTRPGRAKAPQARAKKSLGQNFLVSDGTVDAIIDAVVMADGGGRAPGDPAGSGRRGGFIPVLEIGPGTGALTIPLAERGARIAAFEIDGDLAERLRNELAAYDEVEIVEADVRDLDLDGEGAGRGWDRFVIAGNIPYLLTSTILIKVGLARRCARAVIMMQKEVGERIVAPVGTRGCGILSVFMQAWFDIGRVATVKASSFRPRPKIDSVVLAFDPASRAGAPGGRREFFDFVKNGFSQRRKKLINVLAAGPAGKDAARVLAG
ncbi:MAG TPA: 16S rRNA (adenine(1518)-N(6)/adenine(1519)-N(6))-dimethyltransferase RsmA, partial [Candidatus Krumholzibacterium sp.]|nr:16S rRNA (adenine(1518)-N(6)/adenine(1519)-N(6))-dimethyltransferase RsmA [Candidatus Krumholzibacterium sp.]